MRDLPLKVKVKVKVIKETLPWPMARWLGVGLMYDNDMPLKRLSQPLNTIHQTRHGHRGTMHVDIGQGTPP